VPFLRRALRPTISRLTDKNITSFLSVDDIVVVAHIAPGDEVLAKAFIALAERFRDRYSFAVGSPPERQRSSIGCFNNREGEQGSSSDFDVVGSLERFVTTCSKPVIVELTRRNELENMQVGLSSTFLSLATMREGD
jgi:protein disulfide-isomerase A1